MTRFRNVSIEESRITGEDFIVDEERGFCTCILTDCRDLLINELGDTIPISQHINLLVLPDKFVMTAKCHKDDNFNFELAIELSCSRAKAALDVAMRDALLKYRSAMEKDVANLNRLTDKYSRRVCSNRDYRKKLLEGKIKLSKPEVSN